MKRLLPLLLFPLLLAAQTPTQVKGFFGQAQSHYDITLDQPTVAGQAIILHLYVAGSLWQPGPMCRLAPVQSFCDYNLWDSQGNQFVQINRDYQNLLYIPASKGGTETITVVYTSQVPQNISVVVMVFPDTLVLQDSIASRCDFYPATGQNTICHPYAGDSVNSTDDSTTLSSYPLTSSVSNELFIGFGQFGHCCQTFTGAAGWSTPVWGGEVFLNYATAGPVGTQMTDTLLASPGLPEAQYAYMGINGFKVISIQ
jgi:hypothetical protein